MTHFIERRSGSAQARVPTLVELMQDGFQLLSMLRQGCAPPGAAEFSTRVRDFLDEFASQARRLRHAHEDISSAQYAFCAALDEIVLSSHFPLRSDWERRPLQLTLFGQQLAGEHFFEQLERLRIKGAERLQALQVFHMCLLQGFQGRYAVDGGDRLAYLAARLGDEITHLRGKGKGFAPRAARPDHVVHALRRRFTPWLVAAVFLASGSAAFFGLRYQLALLVQAPLASYQQIVSPPPPPAYIIVTLP